jgi:hypothetical protein
MALILTKNNGFHIFMKISKILSGDVSTLKGIPEEDLTSNYLLYYK